MTHQAEKIWTYDLTTVRPTVQDTTFNMRGQLYRGHTNATALSSSLVASALSSESDDRVLVLARARRYALKTCGKKMRALLLGLAKSIYYGQTSLTKKNYYRAKLSISLSNSIFQRIKAL